MLKRNAHWKHAANVGCGRRSSGFASAESAMPARGEQHADDDERATRRRATSWPSPARGTAARETARSRRSARGLARTAHRTRGRASARRRARSAGNRAAGAARMRSRDARCSSGEGLDARRKSPRNATSVSDASARTRTRRRLRRARASSLPVCRANAWKSRTLAGSVAVMRIVCPDVMSFSAFFVRRMGSGQLRPRASISRSIVCIEQAVSAVDGKL